MTAPFGKIYNRIPKQVIGIQYFPYAPIPNVKHITIKVPDIPSSTFDSNQNDILGPDMTQIYAGNGMKTIEVCTHGEVLLGGSQKAKVNPTDYVIYNQQTLIPIGVIPEKDFNDMYTDKFELCPTCLENAQGLVKPQPKPENLSIPDIVNLIRSGQGWEVGDGTVIRSERDLMEFISKAGIKL